LKKYLLHFFPIFKALLPSPSDVSHVQVIVKAQKYILSEGKRLRENQYHQIGISEEHILAVGIYYYDISNLFDGKLGIMSREDDAFEIPVKEGNFIVFRNDLCYHRFSATSTLVPSSAAAASSSSSSSSNKEQVKKTSIRECKMLTFFLVHPEHSIPDTAQMDVNHRILIRNELKNLLPHCLILEIMEFLFFERQAKESRAKFRKRGEPIYVRPWFRRARWLDLVPR